jgi:polar amino acid transport system substrate-binding protein
MRRRRRVTRRRWASAAVVATALVAGAGCGGVDVPESLPGPTTTTTTAPEPRPEGPDCGNPAASLRPTGPAGTDVPDDSYMAEVRERGRLRVGVDVATLRMSAFDPASAEIVGFDVDIAREVAAALLGDRDAVELVGVPSGGRVDLLVDGRVDMVASTFSPTCERLEDIEFSTEYIRSEQRVLVHRDDPAESLADLAGRRVCATSGSTAMDNILAQPEPGPVPVPVVERADCLVLLQQGEVDAAVTNDTILVGMEVQDPTLHMVGPAISDEPTSLGLPPGHEDWVRYVNAVLEDVRASGRWADIYETWLLPVLGPAEPPTPAYDG